MAKELKLEARARERSFRKEPLRGAEQLDDVEHEIIEYVESDKKHAHQLLEEQLQSYAHRLASLDFQGRFTAIHQTAPDCITEFRAELAKGQDALHARRRDLVEHEEERDNFRKKHGLARPARTLSDAAAFLKWGFLVLLLAVESALNGSFLATGSEQCLVPRCVRLARRSAGREGIQKLLDCDGDHHLGKCPLHTVPVEQKAELIPCRAWARRGREAAQGLVVIKGMASAYELFLLLRPRSSSAFR